VQKPKTKDNYNQQQHAWSIRVPGCQKLQMTAYPVYSCTHMATVGVKGLTNRISTSANTPLCFVKTFFCRWRFGFFDTAQFIATLIYSEQQVCLYYNP